MSPNTLLLPTRSHDSTQDTKNSDFVWEQTYAKNIIDEPYSPIIKQEDTEGPPDPGWLDGSQKQSVRQGLAGWFLRRRPGKVLDGPQSLWDRVVLFLFCFCCVLLLYTLAGFGYSGHDHTACSSLTNLPPTTTTTLVEDVTKFPRIWEKNLGDDADMDPLGWTETNELEAGQPHALGHAQLQENVENVSLISTPTVSRFLHNHAYFHDPQFFAERLTANPHVVHRLRSPPVGVDDDSFDIDKFFDTRNHRNDGKPFALKI